MIEILIIEQEIKIFYRLFTHKPIKKKIDNNEIWGRANSLCSFGLFLYCKLVSKRSVSTLHMCVINLENTLKKCKNKIQNFNCKNCTLFLKIVNRYQINSIIIIIAPGKNERVKCAKNTRFLVVAQQRPPLRVLFR